MRNRSQPSLIPESQQLGGASPASTFYLLPQTLYLLPSTFYLPPSTFYHLPSTFCLLYSGFYLLPPPVYFLPSTFYLLPSTSYLLPSTFTFLLLVERLSLRRDRNYRKSLRLHVLASFRIDNMPED